MKDRPYHHGDLVPALLDAVAAEIRERGVSAVTLRGVARRATVSHTAPAHHVRDKRGLMTAFATQGQRYLSVELDAALDAARDDTADRLVAACVAYARFALARPEHFAVSQRLDVIDPDDPALRAAGQPNFDLLRTAVEAHQRSGWAAGEDSTRIAVMIWASVHGLAELWLGGFVEERLMAPGIESFVTDMIRLQFALPRPTAPDPT